MERDRYDAMTSTLVAWAARESSVVGLVAVGSTSGVGREPDAWSDHDVLVVTTDGDSERLLADLTWLPDASHIVVEFAETDRGRSVIYDSGHLLEVAVFDQSDLDDLPLNTLRVLVDRGRVEERLTGIVQRVATLAAAEDANGTARFHRFLKELVIGLGRYGRGELLSANQRVRGEAMTSLLSLIGSFVPAEEEGIVDNLDPHRRFEQSHPGYAARLNRALVLSIPELADEMLQIAERTLVDRLDAATADSITAVRSVWKRVIAL